MNTLLVAVLAFALPAVFGYDEAFDKIDVHKILADEELHNKYVDCLLDKGPCEVENSAEFRKLIQEVIAEACAKCTPIQKKHIKQVVKALVKKPALLDEFKKKYDPKGEYEVPFIAFMNAE